MLEPSLPEFLHSRQLRIRRRLSEFNADAFVTHHVPNLRYTSLFTGGTGLAILSPGKNWLLVDPRYTTQAQNEVRGFTVRDCRRSLEEACGELLLEMGCRRVCFEPARITVNRMERLRRNSPGRVEWVATGNFLDLLRSVKDSHELKIMKRAAKLTWESCNDIMQLLVPGTCERDVAVELDYKLIRKGAERTSFETIVASGRRSALPHGTATKNKLRKGEFVVVDFGIVFDGYCSDMTRTFYLGSPNSREKRVYKAVREALEKAEAFLQDGVSASQVDGVARQALRRHRLASRFTHSTGHGVGLEIHESPSLHARNPQPLSTGMVVTVEPGVYLPGWGGVRIEDMVAIGPHGCEVLTGFTHELICL